MNLRVENFIQVKGTFPKLMQSYLKYHHLPHSLLFQLSYPSIRYYLLHNAHNMHNKWRQLGKLINNGFIVDCYLSSHFPIITFTVIPSCLLYVYCYCCSMIRSMDMIIVLLLFDKMIMQ